MQKVTMVQCSDAARQLVSGVTCGPANVQSPSTAVALCLGAMKSWKSTRPVRFAPRVLGSSYRNTVLISHLHITSKPNFLEKQKITLPKEQIYGKISTKRFKRYCHPCHEHHGYREKSN